jgi:hypothetical protein
MVEIDMNLKQYIKKIGIREILFIGIIIRLLLMPFFAHNDLKNTYIRAYAIGFYEEYSLFRFTDVFAHAVEVVFLYIYDFIIGIDHFLPVELAREQNAWVNFNVFFMKIPYLLFDLLNVWLILKLAVKKFRIQTLGFYFLNPLLIFAVYIFGRYETFPIFFVLLSLYLSKQKKQSLSALTFGTSLAARSSFLIITPIYAMLVGKNLIQKICLSVLSIMPYGTVLAFKQITKRTRELTWLTTGQHQNFIFGFNFEVSPFVFIYGFIAAYTVLLFYTYEKWGKVRTSLDHRSISIMFAVGFALFYTLSMFHPQYLAWIVPFAALSIDSKKTFNLLIKIFTGLTLLLPFLLLSWSHLLLEIVKPLSATLASINISVEVDKYYSYLKLANIAKSTMSGLFIVYILKHIPFIRND